MKIIERLTKLAEAGSITKSAIDKAADNNWITTKEKEDLYEIIDNLEE